MTMSSVHALQPIERPRSLTEMVTGQIRELIVSGKLELGEQLSEVTLSSQLGVSRTPVREAFLRLEGERLVEVRPQRGTFVFEFDAGKLRDLCELRQVLETGALRIGIERGRRALIGALASEVERATGGFTDGASFQAYDTAFHETLVAFSGNAELIEAYGRITGRIRTIRYRLNRRPEQAAASQHEHAEILHGLQADNDEAALQCLTTHVYSGYQTFLRGLDEEEKPASRKRELT